MKIAIEGCAHGELEKIYDTIQLLEEKENIKIDLLLCCGDFQSTRNLQDLRCMAVPPKYYNICTFYKYYTGEKKAPILTIFIGGNHEASNYLQELAYGGWVAPNIYYLGYAGVINVAGLRIAGISGIYKIQDFHKGRHEISPYNDSTKRSVYHIRNIDVFRLKQISQPIDIFLSHDWPNGIYRYGNVDQLLKKKPFFKNDIETNRLGSAPCKDLLHQLKPNYWFSAHLHCRFAALVPHFDDTNTLQNTTKFLALDKCLPKRKFLQVVDVLHDPELQIDIKHDLEWLTILYLTNHLISIKDKSQYMPGPGTEGRWIFTPTTEEKDFILQKFDNDLTVSTDFVQTATSYDPNISTKQNIIQPNGQINSQTTIFCEKLGIDDPTNLIISFSGKSFEETKSPVVSYNKFIPRSVEIKCSRLNMSLPEPKTENLQSPKSITEKLSLTLPAPINQLEETEISLNLSDTDKESQELNISDDLTDTTIFSDIEISTSTPQRKKFKRRNESIYKVLEES